MHCFQVQSHGLLIMILLLASEVEMEETSMEALRACPTARTSANKIKHA